jgi:hypothetical protein
MAAHHRSGMPCCDLSGFRAGMSRRLSPASASLAAVSGADQLSARGTGGWPVTERKEKGGCDQARRGVVEARDCVVDDSRLGQRHRGRSESDWRASAITIAKAAALVRLSVGALVLVRLSSEVRGHVVAVRRMAVCAGGLLDGETTVHRARMKLHWLDHTGGEPDSEYAGETSEEPVTAHGSNICQGGPRERAPGLRARFVQKVVIETYSKNACVSK